jgi:hypothetical protein
LGANGSALEQPAKMAMVTATAAMPPLTNFRTEGRRVTARRIELDVMESSAVTRRLSALG